MSSAEDDFRALVEVIDRLLAPDGCPWDREQTVLSLSHMVLEEVCEVIDTLSDEKRTHLADELGDLFISAIFMTKAAEKEAHFSWALPFKKAAAKLIRRHPHIFGEGEKLHSSQAVEKQWEAIKSTEQEHAERKSRFDGIPKSLPALAMMQKLVKKAKGVSALNQSVEKALVEPKDNDEEDLGRRIAQLVFEAERKGIQAEQALRRYFSSCKEALSQEERL